MLGVYYSGSSQCDFRVWAPFAKKVSIEIRHPHQREIPLEPQPYGYWQKQIGAIEPGSRYFIRLDKDITRPDPASHFQPEGVHGPSQIVDHNAFAWSDHTWQGIPLEQMIIYELHVGTFTPEGTFEAIISRLNDLRELGINAIEVMPIAQFPGNRNWGYDGVFPFSVHNAYGGPTGLKKLVNACHDHGIAVILDVVYNHLGPEGNYLSQFGPYFTDKYKTPWGEAINFDDAYSDPVRHYFICNALFWFEQYHIDALRLDALHAVFDMSAKPFLRELAEHVNDFSNRRGRKYYLIGESDLNDTKLIRTWRQNGYGLDAQWCDDLHHSLHTLLTNEYDGYYADFGQVDDLIKSLNEGFVYSGQYSKHRKRRHGNSSQDIPASGFVVFSQNHDQVGNRMRGERLANLVSFEALKLAAGTILFSPYIPLLFMGQEYGETAPFLYFVSHTDPALVEAVRKGRANEFKAFGWQGEVPDPQAEETFLKSNIDWQSRNTEHHQILLKFYTFLIKLRKKTPALSNLSKVDREAEQVGDKKLICLHRPSSNSHIICFLNFENNDCSFTPNIPAGQWHKFMDSAEDQWAGRGAALAPRIESGQSLTMPPLSFAAYRSNSDPKKKAAP